MLLAVVDGVNQGLFECVGFVRVENQRATGGLSASANFKTTFHPFLESRLHSAQTIPSVTARYYACDYPSRSLFRTHHMRVQDMGCGNAGF